MAKETSGAIEAVWYRLEPEVAGHLGPETVVERRSDTHARITHLHFLIDGWLGDDLLTTNPVYLATDSLASALVDQFEGVTVKNELKLQQSDIWNQLHGANRALPLLRWIDIKGKCTVEPGKRGRTLLLEPNYDLSLTSNGSLVVSNRVMAMLKSFSVRYARIQALHVKSREP